MKITWLGHAAFRIETEDAVIITDPFIKDNPRAQMLDFEKSIAGVTHIALTHGHGDHIGDSIEIAKQKNIPVIANADLATWLNSQGVEHVSPGNTGGTQFHKGFSATFTIAFHSSAFLTKDGHSQALGEPNGLVFHFDNGPTVYHMGDTDIFSDMSLIDELHQPAIGLVPVGDRFTMGGAVAGLACQRYFNFKFAIPCHYGTFPVLDQTPENFVKAMQESKTKVLVAEIGQSMTF